MVKQTGNHTMKYQPSVIMNDIELYHNVDGLKTIMLSEKKADTKDYLLYILIYIKFLGKGKVQRQKSVFTLGHVWD